MKWAGECKGPLQDAILPQWKVGWPQYSCAELNEVVSVQVLCRTHSIHQADVWFTKLLRFDTRVHLRYPATIFVKCVDFLAINPVSCNWLTRFPLTARIVRQRALISISLICKTQYIYLQAIFKLAVLECSLNILYSKDDLKIIS